MIKKSWKKKQNEEAVSPIVATLLLVLITVAAGVGFYVWFGEYQADTQGQANDFDAAEMLTIAGSTTVYEFSAVGSGMFEEAYPNYKVSVQKGGSGAGVTSAGEGIVDIGSSSSALSTDQLETYPDLVQTLVAYDAVVIVVPEANTHGLVSMTEATLKQIYQCNGGVVGTYSLDGDADGEIHWDEVPTTAGGSTNCTGDVLIDIYDRSVHSGTEETFAKGMADVGKNTLEEAGIATGNSYATNQEIVTALAGNADALGFMAFGLADASDSGLVMIPFQGDAGLVDPNASGFEDLAMEGSSSYDGARGLYYITIGEPTGKAKLFIDYVMTPDVNMEICEAAGYISLYA